MDTVLPADGLQRGQRLERGVAQPLVPFDPVRGRGRLAVVAGVGRVDGEDLALEPALGPRRLRPLLRLEAEAVTVLAGDAPLVGDALGPLEL